MTISTIVALSVATIGTPAIAAVTPASVANTVSAAADDVEPEFWNTEPPATSFPALDGPDTPEADDITYVVDTQAVNFGLTSSQDGSMLIEVNGQNMVLSPPAAPGSFTRLSANTDVRVGTSSHTVIQRQQNRYRSLIQIDDPSAPTTYRWSFGVGSPVQFQNQNGKILVVNLQNGQVLGAVKPPWAKDANGVTVSTSYTVTSGGIGDLVLTVNHFGASYPVVADPSVSFGWYVYVRYSKSEVQSVWAKIAWYGWKLEAALCGLIPVPWVAVACGVIVGAYGNAIADSLEAARNQNHCWELRMTYNGILVGWRHYGC